MEQYCITVRETGARFYCREDETVLSAMIRTRSGPVTHGCFGGGCGVCKVQINCGGYRKVKRMSRAHVSAAEEAAGIALLCCIQPQSGMTVSRVEGGDTESDWVKKMMQLINGKKK